MHSASLDTFIGRIKNQARKPSWSKLMKNIIDHDNIRPESSSRLDLEWKLPLGKYEMTKSAIEKDWKR